MLLAVAVLKIEV